MKAVILAGGYGTRLSEETHLKPKPMIEIGEKPILWHIMKMYSAHGINDFIICTGYKGYIIKEYFFNYALHMSDVTISTKTNDMTIHQNNSEDWQITLIDTGLKTMTGGRLKRVAKYLDDDFCFTYGDGVGDIDITKLIQFHNSHDSLATITATRPIGRFGALNLSDDTVVDFAEKPIQGDGVNWINGGFFVLSKKVIDYIDDDQTIWERSPLEKLTAENQLRAYKHDGFWQPMDTLRERRLLESLWESGNAPWKIWE